MEVAICFGVLGFVGLVLTGVLLIRREDGDFREIVKGQESINTRFEVLEKSLAGIALESQGRCDGLAAQIVSIKSQTDRIEKIAHDPVPIKITAPVSVNLVYRKREQQLPIPPTHLHHPAPEANQ